MRVIFDWNGSITAKQKLEEILDEIPDYNIICDYAHLMDRKERQNDIMTLYRYAPMTSANIESSISSYTSKWNVEEKGTNKTGPILEKIITILYFYGERDQSTLDQRRDFFKQI